MEIKLQLGPLLKIGDPGTPSLSRIARDAKLTRHELNHLLDEDAVSINRHNLAKICRYLVDNGLVKDTELPGKLFARLPEGFWSMLVGRPYVEFCMGARGGPDAHDQYVSGADAVLQAQMLFRMTDKPPEEPSEPLEEPSEPGNETASAAAAQPADPQRVEMDPRFQPGKIDLRIVPTWERNLSNADTVKSEANDFFRRRRPGNRALICLGSVKSNPVIELVIDGIFRRARAFHSEDEVGEPGDRSCPFFLRYRESDPSPASCCGGRQLSAGTKSSHPGIYFETEDGSWHHVPYNGAHDDCALVLYHLRPPGGRLDMVLGGFSGRGTRCLATFLRTGGADKLWPGRSVPMGHVGAFVIHFKLGKAAQKRPTTAMPAYDSEVVHRINLKSLRSRIR